MSGAADGAAVRLLAATAVARVADGERLDEALAALPTPTMAGDRSLLAELSYGTLRWYGALQFLLNRLLHRPLPAERDRATATLHALLLVGLYQLAYLRLPAYAAVAASVAAAARLLPERRGLVNAVLRGFQRRRGPLLAELADAGADAVAHPGWLRRRLRRDWPQHWRELLVANNARPPLTLRVNLCRQNRSDYLAELTAAGIVASAHPQAATAVTLQRPLPVDALPGFHAGRVSVQDAAAQLAAQLLAAQPGERVLDACAAPGGKTGHLLERCPQIELQALDQSPTRLEKVAANLERLGFGDRARLQAADAASTHDWWDGRRFDAVLLDAPCSGSGVIRRHPDIKLRRRAADLSAAAAEQRRLLDALWPVLRSGGRLLYATCSVFAVENRELIADFCAARPDARAQAIVLDRGPDPDAEPWGLASGPGQQLLTGRAGGDGFFYALLAKA